jgi:hypothetical protein
LSRSRQRPGNPPNLKSAGQRQANRKRLDRMKVPVGNAIDRLAGQPRDLKVFDLVALG